MRHHLPCPARPVSARPLLVRACPLRRFAWLPAVLVVWALAPWTTPALAASAEETTPVELTEELLPRVVSEAERQAAELILGYLDQGPAAIYDALAATSSLRSMSRTAALAEIEVRMGPPAGSKWTLRTPSGETPGDRAVFGVEMASGIDDVVELVMAEEGDAWRVAELRCGVDPRQPRPTSDELEDLLAAGTAVAPELPPAPRPATALLLASLLALAAWVAAWHVAPRRRPTAWLALGLVAAATGLAGCNAIEDLFGGDEEGAADTLVASDAPAPAHLGRLLSLRRALAGGLEGTTPEQLQALVQKAVGGADVADPVARAARAWEVQGLLREGRLKSAKERLDELPDPTRMPTVALLRARHALARADADAVEAHFETLFGLDDGHDAHRIESARAFAFLGAEERLEEEIGRLVRRRSREAWPLYTAAELAVIDDEVPRAEELFHAAWIRQPIVRRQLFAQSLLAHVAVRPRVFPLFRFGDHAEPPVGPTRADARSRPLELPEDARSSVVGEHLVVEIGASDGVLEVPGAGALVPAGSVVRSAAERARADARRAFGDLASLVAEVEGRGLADPARRHRASAAAASLVAERRWDDVLRLTSAIADAPESAPTDLVKARATALLRLERSVEATNLLIRVAQSDLANRRRDPTTFYQLGEMLASLEKYDLALRAFDRAQALTRLDISRRRKAQIRLDQELAEASRTWESEHFRLVYPASTGEVYPRRLSWVLEAEWDRLQRWIPVGRLDDKVEVHLFPLLRFLRAYSSNVLVLGIYDGKLRVPLADLASLHPELVQIVSHELAHAMIDVATDGNSPRWLHEGLASHVEMRQRGVNPIPDLHDAGRDLSFTLIEPILDGFGEAQLVELAYSHATWALHYLEAKHGVRSIHRLLDAFEQGHDTASALERTVGMSPERFDLAVRKWSVEEAPQVWPSKLVKYHELFDDLIEREDLGMTVVDPSKIETEEAFRAPSRAQLPQRMRSWHRVYTERARPVKASLSRAMPLLRGQAEGNVQAACVDLERKLRHFLADGQALACPDPRAAQQLGQAYRTFLQVAERCQEGQWKRMRDELQNAMNSLGRANEALTPHGFAP